MKYLAKIFFIFVLVFSCGYAKNILNDIRVDRDAVILDFRDKVSSKDIKSFALTSPVRSVYDIKNTMLRDSKSGVSLKNNSKIRFAQFKKDVVRVVLSNPKSERIVGYISPLSPKQYIIPIPKALGTFNGGVAPVKNKPAPKATISDMIRGEVIVIDPGHGGKDPGAMSQGKREKDVVLAIAKRLKAKLKKVGYTVYLTRENDRFLTLGQRTKLADKKNAKIFISIHANAAPKKSVNVLHGIETFFLQNTRDSRSQGVAARENASVLQGTNKTSKDVILSSVLSGPKILLSNKLAIDVQSHMLGALSSHYKVYDGGVRHAPFWVLVGASRPSILVEVGYITHPTDRIRLFNAQYQDKVAQGIADGVTQYLINRTKEIDDL
ncbi:MAG: N-acetylmuramoyl-L-alanine amidase [Sulfurovaceae bacterium]